MSESATVSRPNELPKTMTAVVAYAPGDYRLETVDVPRAGPDDIIIAVEACGICASDIKTFQGAPSFWGDDKGQPRYVKAPMIPGHEFIGHAVEIGENVAREGNYKVGDRLISEQIVPCEHCRYCRRGEYWMCERHDVYGFQNNVNGGMAKYMRFPKESRTHRIPQDLQDGARGAGRAVCVLGARRKPWPDRASTTSWCSRAPGRWASAWWARRG